MLSLRLRLARVDSATAARRQIDYNGPYRSELAHVQWHLTGNSGSTPSRIQHEQRLLLLDGYRPSHVFHPMCGPGRWAQYLDRLEFSCHYTGVDINEQAVRLATRLQMKCVSAEFQWGDIRSWAPPSDVDTVVLGFEALNAFPPAVIQEILRSTVGSRRVQRIVISLRDLNSRSVVGDVVTVGISSMHPITASPTLVQTVSRWLGDAAGAEDRILTLSRHGLRIVHSALWIYDVQHVSQVLETYGFVGLAVEEHEGSAVGVWDRA